MKIVINACFGGFGLSTAAYEKLIEWGVPVRKYVDQERDPVTRLYKPQPLNDGEVIFDRAMSAGEKMTDLMMRVGRRYWDCWLERNRTHPLLIRVVEELGDKASGDCAKLVVEDIPPGTLYRIDEYDGNERVEKSTDIDWSVAT